MLKRELARIPLFGLYARCGEQIAIDRARGRAALAQVSQQARKVLADGRQLLIFPEGTRRAPGAEPQYKFGVAFIYTETGALCLPVALNSGLFWPRRSFLRRPGTVLVEFLEPIRPGLDKATFLKDLQSPHRGSLRPADAGIPCPRPVAGAVWSSGLTRSTGFGLG